MKILYLIESDDPGGAENVMLSLIEYFKEKYPIYVGCFKKGWIYNELKKRRLNPQPIPTNKGSYDIKLLYHLIKLIKKEKINLICGKNCWYTSHIYRTWRYSSYIKKIRQKDAH